MKNMNIDYLNLNNSSEQEMVEFIDYVKSLPNIEQEKIVYDIVDNTQYSELKENNFKIFLNEFSYILRKDRTANMIVSFFSESNELLVEKKFESPENDNVDKNTIKEILFENNIIDDIKDNFLDIDIIATTLPAIFVVKYSLDNKIGRKEFKFNIKKTTYRELENM